MIENKKVLRVLYIIPILFDSLLIYFIYSTNYALTTPFAPVFVQGMIDIQFIDPWFVSTLLVQIILFVLLFICTFRCLFFMEDKNALHLISFGGFFSLILALAVGFKAPSTDPNASIVAISVFNNNVLFDWNLFREFGNYVTPFGLAVFIVIPITIVYVSIMRRSQFIQGSIYISMKHIITLVTAIITIGYAIIFVEFFIQYFTNEIINLGIVSIMFIFVLYGSLLCLYMIRNVIIGKEYFLNIAYFMFMLLNFTFLIEATSSAISYSNEVLILFRRRNIHQLQFTEYDNIVIFGILLITGLIIAYLSARASMKQDGIVYKEQFIQDQLL